jgi:fructokinase
MMDHTWPEVVCLGEALIDLLSTKTGVRLDRAPAFRKAAGGAPANVAVGVTRLGGRSAFLGAVASDPLGTFLRETLQRHGVNVDGMCRSRKRPTALALVSLAADGDRDFLFYADHPAHFDFRLSSPMHALIRHARILHYGSISLIAEPSRSATLAAARRARQVGCLCSYDPNLRRNLWPSAATARRWLREGLRYADCVKVNKEELAFLTGTSSVFQGLRRLTDAGPRVAIATLGPEGCAYVTPTGEGKVAGFPAHVVDTTGAGDAFVAGLLAYLTRRREDVAATVSNPSELETILTVAKAAAALSTERRGGIPSLPSLRRVRKFLRAHHVRANLV